MRQGTLRVTEGTLDSVDINKSYWYSIGYEWSSNSQWKYCEFDDNLELTMYDDKGNRIIVPHCHTDDAHRTLGVMLLPEDNNATQIEIMKAIAVKFGDKIRVGYIKGHDVMQAL